MQHAYSRDDEMEIVGPMTAEEYFAEALRALDKPPELKSDGEDWMRREARSGT